MKKLNLKNIDITFAHNQIKRKLLVAPGDLDSKIQTVNYAWLEAGESFTPHKHDDCEELYFFLQGEGLMKINDKEFKVKKDDFVIVEVEEWHSLKNPNKKKLVFFTIRILI